MNKTKQIFAGLVLMALCLGTAFAAEECPVNRQEGNVCLPEGFPVENIPSSYPLNLMHGVTKVSNDVYDLHMLILWICVFIGIVVFGAMFYSIYHHRKSKGHEAAHFHENLKIEVLWTVIPFLILVAMAIPATKTLYELNKPPENESKIADKASDKNAVDYDMTIKVTGYQWYWKYDYLGTDKSITSKLDKLSVEASKQGSGVDPKSVPHYLLRVDKPLVIPTHKKIRFVFTSADVIHSWWVPDLGWKKDANPGFINEAWTQVDKPGVFRGQCTELCGRGHAFMPVVVIAMDQDDYDKWATPTTPPDEKVVKEEYAHDELVQAGKAVYVEHCASCHQAGGEGIPGAFPAITGSKVVTGDIKAQTKLVLNGKGMMPAFATILKPHELAQVITFTRNGLGNKVGDEIQPKDLSGPEKEATPVKAEKKEEKTTAEVVNKKEAAPAKTVATDAKKAVATEKPKADASLSKDDLIAKGKSVYNNCAGCHGEDGKGGMGPALSGSPVVKGDINAQIKLMMNGKNAMPALGKTLSPVDLAAVVTYTRNALGNSVGDSIQPSAIEALKSAKPAAKPVEDE